MSIKKPSYLGHNPISNFNPFQTSIKTSPSSYVLIIQKKSQKLNNTVNRTVKVTSQIAIKTLWLSKQSKNFTSVPFLIPQIIHKASKVRRTKST